MHGVSAALIPVLLGSVFRSSLEEDAAEKTAALGTRAPVAVLALLLTIAGLVWWWRFDRKPAPLPRDPDWQAAIVCWTHRTPRYMWFGGD